MPSDTRQLEKEIAALSKEVSRSTENRKELIRTLNGLMRQLEKLGDRMAETQKPK